MRQANNFTQRDHVVLGNERAEWGRNAKSSRGVGREQAISSQLSTYRKHARTTRGRDRLRVRKMA